MRDEIQTFTQAAHAFRAIAPFYPPGSPADTGAVFLNCDDPTVESVMVNQDDDDDDVRCTLQVLRRATVVVRELVVPVGRADDVLDAVDAALAGYPVEMLKPITRLIAALTSIDAGPELRLLSDFEQAALRLLASSSVPRQLDSFKGCGGVTWTQSKTKDPGYNRARKQLQDLVSDGLAERAGPGKGRRGAYRVTPAGLRAFAQSARGNRGNRENPHSRIRENQG